jgi:hypothetical protein
VQNYLSVLVVQHEVPQKQPEQQEGRDGGERPPNIIRYTEEIPNLLNAAVNAARAPPVRQMRMIRIDFFLGIIRNVDVVVRSSSPSRVQVAGCHGEVRRL